MSSLIKMFLITEEVLGLFNSPSLQGISIALTSLVTLFVGFILGALCWKVRTIIFKLG